MSSLDRLQHPIWGHGYFNGIVYIICIFTFVLLFTVIIPCTLAAYSFSIGPFKDVIILNNNAKINNVSTNDFQDTDFDF